jgi:transposase
MRPTANTGRDSIPPERLLRASLIQTLHSIRSERMLVEHIEYNLLYRWFVALGMDEEVWHHSTFSANRDRLLNERIARLFFNKVLHLAEWKGLLSNEHFTVDGTLIEVWASMKRFVAKDGSGKPSEDGGRAIVQVAVRGVGEGDGADGVHLRRLQPDPDGDDFWLAFVDRVGVVAPGICRKADEYPVQGIALHTSFRAITGSQRNLLIHSPPKLA